MDSVIVTLTLGDRLSLLRMPTTVQIYKGFAEKRVPSLNPLIKLHFRR